MKRMWSKNELKKIIRDLVQSGEDFTFGGDVSIAGDVSVGGDLAVTGEATLPKINGEENPSVKPIYCHPITFTHNDANSKQVATCTCLIFNNSATAFTKTTFISWIRELFSTIGGTIRIMLSGAYYDELNEKQAISAYMGISQFSQKIYITGNYVDGSGEYNMSFATDNDFSNYLSSFADAVNKIN